jgi:hypothetical protein
MHNRRTGGTKMLAIARHRLSLGIVAIHTARKP